MSNNDVTIGDRVSATLIMAVAAFVTGLIIWALIFVFSWGNVILQIDYIIGFTLAFIVFAFISPSWSIEVIGEVWKIIENVFTSEE